MMSETISIDPSIQLSAGLGASVSLTSPSSVTTSLTANAFSGGFTTGTGWTSTNTNASPWFTQSTVAPKIKLDGEGADIVVNGASLVDAINSILDRLNCLQINPKLEEEWNQLRILGDQYRKLEQEILDKQATWNRLKAMPAPEID